MIFIKDGSLPLEYGTVVTVGNFDGVHTGHRLLMETVCRIAAEKALTPVVWTFDVHPGMIEKRGVKLLCDNAEKISLIGSLGIKALYNADYRIFRDMEPEYFVKEVLCRSFNAKAVVCGYDFRFGAGAAGDTELLRAYLENAGVKCVVVPPLTVNGEVVSSSAIRGKLADGDVGSARAMLGRNYGFSLPVIHGLENGHKLGSPTINQLFPQDRIEPCHGVYAVYCFADGKKYNGIANIGTRPTVAEKKTGLLCETYIFDFDGDLYGKNVRVELLEMIRREEKFASFSQLKAQISEDIKRAKGYFALN